jgi:two-component system, NarL family, response regulator
MTIRLLLADDHVVVRMGLVAVLGHHKDLLVVAQAQDGKEAVRLHGEHRPDVTLMDLRMPGLDGIAATAAIRAAAPDAKVLMLTTYDTEEDVHRALAAGASGYLLKDAGPDELVQAIRAVAAGERWLPEHIKRQIANREDSEALTARQIEVLGLLAQGRSNKAIGLALGISEDGAKAHVKQIFLKLRVADRAEAVAEGMRRGILTLER